MGSSLLASAARAIGNAVLATGVVFALHALGPSTQNGALNPTTQGIRLGPAESDTAPTSPTEPGNDLSTGSAGIALIMDFEEFRSCAYDDAQPWITLKPGDPVRGTLTIGYGHTGSDVELGLCIDREKAAALLREDVAKVERGLARILKVETRSNEYDALVSFGYNVGVGALARSTLLKRLHAGDRAGAATEFTKWVITTIDGKKVKSRGLVRRRNAERLLFVCSADNLADCRDA